MNIFHANFKTPTFCFINLFISVFNLLQAYIKLSVVDLYIKIKKVFF